MEEAILLQLFKVCKRQGCGAAIDGDNIEISRNGAAVQVKTLCNNSHKESWSSSTVIGEGKSQLPLVNVEMVYNCTM